MIQDKETWDNYVKVNSKDAYSKCCVDVARKTMELLDAMGDKPITPEDTYRLICQADKDIKTGGITGFMAGCVSSMISEVHSRGKEWRRAWNKDNGVDDPKLAATVNPAILTIGPKEK